ncbi:SWIM zinc finger domain-containing protein [bacterium]|nr:SWIM zinc finger domain-containing protein [bacterium]
MLMALRYFGRSEMRSSGKESVLSFSPNLARPPLSFDGELLYPVRFREAISSLHDVVVSDQRFHKKDKTAYLQWKAEEKQQEQELFRIVQDREKKLELEKISKEPVPAGLENEFHKMHDVYWTARRKWANEMARHDPELFRALVPCDPVVTVASDVVYFEAFSKDESSYGCLFVDRNAIGGNGRTETGTTNVDYSLALYDHFQKLRTYRQTRLLVDPAGFEVKLEASADYREEKIDLPPSWLRGFGQIQSAMTLPMRRVTLPVESVYSILAYLKRHREKTGPRSIRFKLTPGVPPVLTLDPWGVTIQPHGHIYEGPREEQVKVWGRRRLMVLARLLPLAEKIEVGLLGSGLPSFWIVYMGEMRFLLALSGWTRNDWTSSAALELMTATYKPDAQVVNSAGRHLLNSETATFADLHRVTGTSDTTLLGSMNLLARQGQVIYDITKQVYRYRQVMPVALSEAVIGPEHPELAQGKWMHAQKMVRIQREEALSAGRRALVAKVEKVTCEGILDSDGAYSRAKCSCSYFFKNRLRGGPCRHLLALQLTVHQKDFA